MGRWGRTPLSFQSNLFFISMESLLKILSNNRLALPFRGGSGGGDGSKKSWIPTVILTDKNKVNALPTATLSQDCPFCGFVQSLSFSYPLVGHPFSKFS